MRPTYETTEHLSAEKQLADFLQQKFNCTFKKLPVKYNLDYAMERDGVIKGFIELKCRTVPSTKYGTLMMTLHKLMAAEQITRTSGLPCYLGIQWTDQVKWIEIKHGIYEYAFFGRKDRNDPYDAEPMALIPINKFKPLTGFP